MIDETALRRSPSKKIRGVMEEPMKKYIADIREKTSGMNRKEAYAYIWTYYWYHIMGILAMIALILLFAVHYGFGNKKPLFTCILVNQEASMDGTQAAAETFADYAGLPRERVAITSDYMFSYGDVRLEGVNEGSYEKFFFQWRNEEIDAVIIPESFYQHVKEMGGNFRVLKKTEGLVPYMDGDSCTAVLLGHDTFTKKVSGKEGEKLLLAFPENGKHEETCKVFLQYLKNKEREGEELETIFNR